MGARRRRLALMLGIGLVGLTGPASSLAATPVGDSSFTPQPSCGGAFTLLQTGVTGPNPGQYIVPSAGVVTQWSFHAGAIPPGQVQMKLARHAGGNNFTIVAQSGLEAGPAANALGTYQAQIPVSGGEFLGVFLSSGHCVLANASFSAHVASGSTSGTQPYSPAGSFHIPVSAVLEPDADNDGFGDETQDQCPTDAATQGPCPDTAAPDTTITSQPKAKTKKKKATFEFTGTDARVVASFECSLNGAPLSPCTSPRTVKGKKGKNHFEVRAKDAAGNVDATPATYDWKVKKKKKK
jgi:hypothetical protein